MSAYLQPDLYVRIEQMDDGPRPLPLLSGFRAHRAYHVLGLHLPSETAEAYFILPNDRSEVWFISNRHLRVVGLLPKGGLHKDLPLDSTLH